MFGSRNQKPLGIEELKRMMKSAKAVIAPKTATELESLTTAIPSSQSDLNSVFYGMISNKIDQFDRDRLIPSKDDWGYLREILPRFDDNGQFVSVEPMVIMFPPIFDGANTAVYEIGNDPTKVVRYHVHHQTAFSEMDPTIVDYWFLKRLESAHIAPKVYYYSQPLNPNKYENGSVIEAGEGKTKNFRPDNRGIQPSIRYTEMEKVGRSIYSYMNVQPNRRMSFTEAIRIGGQMLQLMETLHSYDIIHADAHIGNFAIHNTDDRLVMLDFGRSKIIQPSALIDRHLQSRSSYWLYSRASCWEMQKYPLSYRDDIYRVMCNIAEMIHGNDYASYMDHVCNEQLIPAEYKEGIRDHVIDMKLNGQLFEIPKLETLYTFPKHVKTSFSLADRVPDYAIVDVRRLLSEMMSQLLNVDMFMKPDYSLLQCKLIDILAVVEGTNSLSMNPNNAFKIRFTHL